MLVQLPSLPLVCDVNIAACGGLCGPHGSLRELVFELRRLSHKERVVTRRHQQFETLLENVLAGHIRQRFDVLDDLDVTKSEAQTTADVNNGDESIEGENPDVALEARQNSRPLEITDEVR